VLHVLQRSKETRPHQTYSAKMLFNEIFGKESDCFKVMVPAVLYLIQNNLQYLAASKLDAATFQVTYQMKIITTAIFSVMLLKRRLGMHQWIAIALLSIGIALVQLPTGSTTTTTTTTTTTSGSEHAITDRIVGFLAVIIACVLSGLSGVYFEKILKKSRVTVWARNVQLSLFSIIPGYLIGVLLLDGEKVREKGFFGGYTRWTVLAIGNQAFGGILIAVVVKYADNILKGFATSISIILSSAVSYFVFQFHITLFFVIGGSLVMYATYLYGQQQQQQQQRTKSKPKPKSKMDYDHEVRENSTLPLEEMDRPMEKPSTKNLKNCEE